MAAEGFAAMRLVFGTIDANTDYWVLKPWPLATGKLIAHQLDKKQRQALDSLEFINK